MSAGAEIRRDRFAQTRATIEARWLKDVQWAEVRSSNVAQLGFRSDPEQEARGVRCGWLFVRFHDGDTYAFKHVPTVVFAELKVAESVGRFFHLCVKGRYDSVKIEDG